MESPNKASKYVGRVLDLSQVRGEQEGKKEQMMREVLLLGISRICADSGLPAAV